MEMEIWIQRGAKSLRERHSATARGRETVGLCSTTMEALESAQPDADDLRRERRLARECKAKTTRKREHPLPHRHLGQNLLDHRKRDGQRPIRTRGVDVQRQVAAGEVPVLRSVSGQHLVPVDRIQCIGQRLEIAVREDRCRDRVFRRSLNDVCADFIVRVV